jgi:hypothetical protein
MPEPRYGWGRGLPGGISDGKVIAARGSVRRRTVCALCDQSKTKNLFFVCCLPLLESHSLHPRQQVGYKPRLYCLLVNGDAGRPEQGMALAHVFWKGKMHTGVIDCDGTPIQKKSLLVLVCAWVLSEPFAAPTPLSTLHIRPSPRGIHTPVLSEGHQPRYIIGDIYYVRSTHFAYCFTAQAEWTAGLPSYTEHMGPESRRPDQVHDRVVNRSTLTRAPLRPPRVCTPDFIHDSGPG